MKLPYKTNTPVRVTSPYGYRVDPITGAKGAWHGGVDLVSDGDKTVYAVVGGEVWFSRMITDPTNKTSEWGNYICIFGDDGRVHYYCHLAQRLVSAGERVEAGRAIGIEGNTGKVWPTPKNENDKTSGRHLHYEVRVAAEQVDPTEILGIPNMVGTYIVNDKTEDETMSEANDKKHNDSEPAEWAKDAVEWAVENEIIFGDENGDLMLRQPCTREQMLVFLHRFAELIGKA